MTIVSNAAFEIPGFRLGVLEANVDMSSEATWQFAPVAIGAATGTGLQGPSALVAAADGGVIAGILQNNPQLGEAGEVFVSGVSKALIGGTVAAGAKLMVASGKLVTATTGSYIVGIALQAAASGTVASVLLLNEGVAP